MRLKSSPQNIDVTKVERIASAWPMAREKLIGMQSQNGCWHGRLSSSPLATATAVSALSLAAREKHFIIIRNALEWLENNQNEDGGWGDSTESPSNISTTMLVEGALLLASQYCKSEKDTCLLMAEKYLTRIAGPTAPKRIEALRRSYGEDRTFAVPIMANCALAAGNAVGEVPEGARIGWEDIPGLPFELACVPRGLYRILNLRVVSYAMPALIAIGRLLHFKKSGGFRLRRLVRNLVLKRAMRKLEAIQPADGGFLEAVPLTSFVVMSLAASDAGNSPVLGRGLRFLEKTVRKDGSWPIDVNLSHWLTSQAVAALAAGGDTKFAGADNALAWIINCQHVKTHKYTGAAPGGWAWTDLDGGVPDTDDTAAALIALSSLGVDFGSDTVSKGRKWLLNLQNRDGGWPTFCRGWGKLPFDRSSPDLTAHAIKALTMCAKTANDSNSANAVRRGFKYLRDTQHADGSWLPLWFGSQQAEDGENPVFGTARVLVAYGAVGGCDLAEALMGLNFLIDAQHENGGWGAAKGIFPTIEETAVAVYALSFWRNNMDAWRCCINGAQYLAACVQLEKLDEPAPIGLYFAKLWYSEMNYPIIWTVAALESVVRQLRLFGNTNDK